MLTRHVQRGCLVVGATIAALLFFVGGAALRLLMGPISLGPFASVIEDSLNHSVPGVVIRFDQAVLEWSRPEGKVNLIVLGTKVFDLEGHIIAQAPKADLDFDAAAMVQGHLNLKRFGLIGVQLTGVRSKEGAIYLGFGPEQGTPDLFETLRNVLQNSAAGGSSFDSFAIRNARLAFRDEPTGLFIVSPDANFTLQDTGKELDVSLDSAIELSGAPIRLTAKAVLRENGDLDRGSFTLKGLSIPALVQNSTNFAALTPYRLISDITASFTLDQNGAFTTSDFHAAGNGTILTAVLKSPLRLDKFDVTGRYDGTLNKISLEDFSFNSNVAAAKGKANVTLAWKDGALQTVSGDMDAGNVRFDMPQWFYQPFAISHLSLQAAYDRAARAISWNHAVIESGAFSADLSGDVHLAKSGSPAMTLNGTLNSLPVAEALKYWPMDIGTGAREWIAENIPEGRVGPLRVDADFPAGALDGDSLPDESLTMSFPFEAMTAHYIAGMTPITAAHGNARLTGDSFHVTVDGASVGPLALSGGDVIIPDLHTHGVIARIKAHGDGRMSDVLRLIDQPPLGYPKRFGINPANVNGQASVDLDFALPLLRDVSLDQLRIGVQAKATELALPIDNRKFEHGMVSFTVDTKSLSSQGTAVLQGVPVSFKWTEDFTAPDITTRIDLTGRLDDANRPGLGLSNPAWLTGPMPVTLALYGRRFQLKDADLKADLTNAVAEFPTINFAKHAGTRANATAQLHFGEGGALSMNDLVVMGQDLSIRGKLQLDAAGRLVNVSLSDMRSGVNDFALNIAPLPGEGLAFQIQGKSLDATHFFADKKKTPNASTTDEMESDLQHPLSINAKVDRLVFHDSVGFRNVTMAVSFAPNEKLTEFGLEAMGTGKGKVTGHMETVKGMRNLTLDTDDAGAFIDTFMNFSSVRGGKLNAKIDFPSDAPNAAGAKTPPPDYQGTITLSNIVITDQPFFARFFSAGSLEGPLRLLQGEGIPLTTVTVPFNARAKMVTIREGRAAGPAIGATFGGTLDRKAEKLDMTGTLVPIYGLNNLLGAVPLLGDLLNSRKGEGIFGLTYAMKGNLNEPAVSLNPLSVLTPGIFRRIFEFAPPKDAPVPQVPQPQALAEPTPAPPP
ncbi:MAG TPA: DUF3971 domain-containing protein, partial [Micropepsaceae bacterium]|nr:DUF3971 domain-containing protein [Micropepsaceae bacterium]